MTEFPSIVTASLARQIAESLREMILSGKLKIDERLPTEDELAVRFGVSRPTIREALKRLAAENLIQSRRGPGGTLVKRPSLDDVSTRFAEAMRLLAGLGEFKPEAIFEARSELESLCCRLAAKRRKKADLDNMRAELTQQRDPKLSDEEFCASDVRFHRVLVEATQNPILQCVLFAISEALQPITNLALYRFRDRKVVCDQHQRLIKALDTGDADAAVAALRKQAQYLTHSYGKARDWRRTHPRRKTQVRSGSVGS